MKIIFCLSRTWIDNSHHRHW